MKFTITNRRDSPKNLETLPYRWYFVFVALGLFSSICLQSCKENAPSLTDWEMGGDFELSSKDNPRWKFSEQAKEANLIFFGYTSCPDYCPMTLSKFQKVNTLLGKKKSQVQYVFISLDDRHDNPEILDRYVRFYVENGVGLVGAPDQIQKVISAYKGSFQRNERFIDHSTYTYLVDKNLKTRYIFKHADPPEKIVELVLLLLR